MPHQNEHMIIAQQKGFAAWLHMQGLQIASVSSNECCFHSPLKTQADLEREYANSESSRFNSSFIQISQMIGHQHPAYEAIVPASIHYDVNGRISSIVENVDGQNRTRTFTYHANNTVNTETVVYNGVTQVKTYIYTDGKVTYMTVNVNTLTLKARGLIQALFKSRK